MERNQLFSASQIRGLVLLVGYPTRGVGEAVPHRQQHTTYSSLGRVLDRQRFKFRAFAGSSGFSFRWRCGRFRELNNLRWNLAKDLGKCELLTFWLDRGQKKKVAGSHQYYVPDLLRHSSATAFIFVSFEYRSDSWVSLTYLHRCRLMSFNDGTFNAGLLDQVWHYSQHVKGTIYHYEFYT
jgi:hypothetical protein